jgi:hypothetical protein
MVMAVVVVVAAVVVGAGLAPALLGVGNRILLGNVLVGYRATARVMVGYS